MKNKVRIIPFQVVEQLSQFNEVPQGVALIGAEEVWKQTKGQGITVAVLDTGCEVTHPDLQERIIEEEILRTMISKILMFIKTIMVTVLT